MSLLQSFEFIPGVKWFETEMHDSLFQHSVFGAIVFLIVSHTGVYKFVGKMIEVKDKNIIKNEIKLLKEKKEQTQPTKIMTSGSTFKNPIDQTNKKVWQLIKESVPLEKSFGDASISQKHCNFFINRGNAKFEDMKKLINFVSESVLNKTGIKLETEIKILE